MLQPGHPEISTITKNPFNISPKIFRHGLSFVRISEVIALSLHCIKTNSKA